MLLSHYNDLKTNFRIRITEWERTEVPSSTLHKLADQGSLELLLQHFASNNQSPCKQVTGSLWVKRYCALIAGSLFTFIHGSQVLDLSYSNVGIRVEESGLNFHLERAFVPLDGYTREKRREHYIQHILRDHVGNLFLEVEKTTGIDKETLWSTLSYLLAYWKVRWLKDATSELIQARIPEDYQYIIDHTNEIIDNFRSIPSPLQANEPILIRSKCCLNYCMPGDDRYCYTCPRITDERRIQKYIAAHA